MKTLKLIIGIVIIFAGIYFWKYSLYSEQTIHVTGPTYEVISGDSFSSILQKETGSNVFTRIYLKSNTPDFSLQKGRYALSGDYTINTFLKALEKPINEDEQITLLEGWNIYDIDKELTKQGLAEQGEFITYVTTKCHSVLDTESSNNDPESSSGGQCFSQYNTYHFLTELDSLEGYLYPDTYNINPNTFSIEKLVSQMLSNFNTKVYQPLFSHADNETIFDSITMASIVQKEANIKDNPQELAIIAGILKKRLDEGWQIGADATVCYAHKIATQDCTPAAVLENLYDVNEYNTRAIAGPPAGPIANPELTVIQATLRSTDSEYYYYLHDNSGQIHYGRTDEEHNRNKNSYLR